jgi:hypothetical protein
MVYPKQNSLVLASEFDADAPRQARDWLAHG